MQKGNTIAYVSHQLKEYEAIYLTHDPEFIVIEFTLKIC